MGCHNSTWEISAHGLAHMHVIPFHYSVTHIDSSPLRSTPDGTRASVQLGRIRLGRCRRNHLHLGVAYHSSGGTRRERRCSRGESHSSAGGNFGWSSNVTRRRRLLGSTRDSDCLKGAFSPQKNLRKGVTSPSLSRDASIRR